MKRKMTFRIFFIVFFILLSVSSSFSETIISGSGQVLQGRIQGFSQNGVKFFGERYFVLQLDNIRDAKVDSVEDPQELRRQQKNVQRLLKVIDKEKFLIKDLGEQIREWLYQKKYDELDALAENFLKTEQRFPSGDWKIYHFYKEIKNDIGKRDVANYLKRVALIEAWMKHKPDSTAAKICLMGVLRDLAWAYRGSGYSNTVTEKGSENFKKTLKKIIEIGNTLRNFQTKDPGFYIYLISASNGYGVDKDKIKALAKESATINPSYFHVYNTTMNALFPRWGGESGELEDFADWVSSLTETPADFEMYFQGILSIKDLIKDRQYRHFDFDWEKIKQGFNEYKKKYHPTDGNFHFMAKLSCLYGDQQAAKKYFSRTDGEWNHFAKQIWGNSNLLKQFKKWSIEKADINYKNILKAIFKEEFPELSSLIEKFLQYGSVNKADVYGNTLLHLLVERNLMEPIKQLIELGADVNKYNANGYTPLHLAAQQDRVAIINLLLENGADIKATSEYKNTAIHFASKNGFIETVKALLTKDIDLLNVTNKHSTTPLHNAALGGYVSVVKLFLKYNQLDLNAQTNYGNTSLHLAVSRGHTEIVQLLIEGQADPNIQNLNKHTALSMAKEQGFLDVIAYLKSQNTKDSNNATSEDARKKAVKLYKQASTYFSAQHYRQAKKLYLKALEHNPNYFLAYYSLALVAWQFEKDLKKADEYMNKSIELNPNNVESYYILGRINFDLNRPEVYRPLFQKYIKLAPDTYNTKDLKKNYADLLTNSPKGHD